MPIGIQYDPAACHESGGRRDPWLYIIACRKGHMQAHSDTSLPQWWDSRKRLKLKCHAMNLYQDGDEGKSNLFNSDDIEGHRATNQAPS